MLPKTINRILPAALATLAVMTGGCETIDDNRVPSYLVKINLADAGLWNTYGVSGFGMQKRFIREERQPAGFRWSADSSTGYGGVLLIGGMDAFSGDTNVPLAYDLSCPVERKPEVRIEVDLQTFEAVCPVCGSHYDVTMAGGAPLSGPAASDKYGLRRYQCVPAGGGYYITN